MAALVAVDDFRRCYCESPLQAGHHKSLLKRTGQLIIHNLATEPVNDGEEIHEPFPHADIGDIDAPNLIDTGDIQVAE